MLSCRRHWGSGDCNVVVGGEGGQWDAAMLTVAVYPRRTGRPARTPPSNRALIGRRQSSDPPPPLYSRVRHDDRPDKVTLQMRTDPLSLRRYLLTRTSRQGQAEWRRKGNNQRGEGMATMGGNGDDEDNAQQLNNYKKHIIGPFNCN